MVLISKSTNYKSSDSGRGFTLALSVLGVLFTVDFEGVNLLVGVALLLLDVCAPYRT